MLAAPPFFALLLTALWPQVEDPLPDTIGLGFPFAAAGIGGVIAGVARTQAPPAKREQAINKGGLIGFFAGAAFYLVALVVQIGF